MLKFSIAALMVVGCSNPTPSLSYTLILDESLSMETREEVLQAVQNWEDILDGKLTIDIRTGHCPSVSDLGVSEAINMTIGADIKRICVQASTLAFCESLDNNVDVIGFTERAAAIDNSIIYLPMDVDDKLSPAEMVAVISHEIGHGMGLQHTQKSTIMCWNQTCQSPFITCDDQTQWTDIRGISDKSQSCPHGGSYTLQH